MSELLLIPCSNSKNKGGDPAFRGRTLKNELPEADGNRLVELRQEVASAFGIFLPPEEGRGLPLIPAFRRYSGNLYGQVKSETWNALRDRADVDLVIVSALYGLIYWDEPIIEYDAAMSGRVGERRRLHTWWRQNGLGEILATLISSRGYERVRSLLSGDYENAVKGAADLSTDADWLLYEYSGLGTGSTYYRGRDINRVLGEGAACPRCRSPSTKRLSKDGYYCQACSSSFRV